MSNQQCRLGKREAARAATAPWMSLLQSMVVLLGITTLLGCGESGPTLIPVQGKVTMDGKPAEEGGVVFHSGMNQYLGGIKPDGTYEIMYNRKPGAPIGKYKVTVFVTQTPKDAQGNLSGLPVTLSNKKFMSVQSTTLEVEVSEAPSPEAYDLKVTH